MANSAFLDGMNAGCGCAFAFLVLVPLILIATFNLLGWLAYEPVRDAEQRVRDSVNQPARTAPLDQTIHSR